MEFHRLGYTSTFAAGYVNYMICRGADVEQNFPDLSRCGVKKMRLRPYLADWSVSPRWKCANNVEKVERLLWFWSQVQEWMADDFRMGAESRWIEFRRKFLMIFVLFRCFLWQRIAIPQSLAFCGIQTIGLALSGVYLALFAFLLKFSSGNPGIKQRCTGASGVRIWEFCNRIGSEIFS